LSPTSDYEEETEANKAFAAERKKRAPTEKQRQLEQFM
jgi:hypothetical protein